MFQSRNRESYLFKESEPARKPTTEISFQSRNRESYLFKLTDSWYIMNEYLFQSRNRESYLFKYRRPQNSHWPDPLCLFQSRNRESYLFKQSLRGVT